jgi:Holliday junction resolvase
MRDLIRQILKEEEETYDTLEMIRDYSGGNDVLNDLRRKLRNKGSLTDKQIQYAIKLFKKEHWSETVASKIGLYEYKHLKNLVLKLGIQTYNEMIRSEKKLFFTQNFDTEDKTIVGKPGQEWIDRNEKDLEFFKSHIVDSGKKFRFPDRNGAFTVTQEIDKLFDLLEMNDFQGFIEKGEWSILNRLGSNWSNWAKMIGISERDGYLGNGDDISKIEKYFEQQPILDIIKKRKPNVKLPNIMLRMFPTMSLAEFDLAEAFQEVDENFKSIQLEKIKNRIKSTTESGESVERDFISWLETNQITEIRNFSSFGNVVDITFSVDLMAKLNGEWVPIQVKSSESSAATSQIHKFDIGGIAIYPAPKKMDCGNWIYFKTNRGFKIQGSFDEDFLNVHCERNDDEDIED